MKYYKLTGRKGNTLLISYAANVCLSYAIEDFCNTFGAVVLNAVKVTKESYIGNARLN